MGIVGGPPQSVPARPPFSVSVFRMRCPGPGSWLLVLIGLLASMTTVCAQEKRGPHYQPQSYVPFPIEGDPEALLQEKLQQAKGREEVERWLHSPAFEGLLREMVKHGAQHGLDKELTSDPVLLRQVLEGALRDEAANVKGPQDLEELTRKLKPFAKPQGQKGPVREGPLKSAPNQAPPTPQAGPPPDVPPPTPATPEADEEPLADWLRERLIDLGDSRLGQVLHDSPAFKQGLMDLQESLLRQRGAGGAPPPWDLHKLVSQVHLPDWNLSRLKGGWDKLHDLPMPRLPRPQLPFDRPGPWHLGTPTPPAGGPGGWQVALWLLLFAAGGFLLLRGLARLKARGTGPADGGWRLGPWPVEPDRVTTRAELVRAFEYLALLQLGPAAQTWNHLVLAEGLAGAGPDTTRQGAADELGALYEQARYAPDEAPLSAEALAAARRDLCLLAGVACP